METTIGGNVILEEKECTIINGRILEASRSLALGEKQYDDFLIE